MTFASSKNLSPDGAINPFFSIFLIAVTQRCFPLFHLHGKIARGPPVSALLEIMLLRVHITLVE